MAKSADAFRTISEVAEWLGVQTHVLRFWESKFTQVKPVKRAGGRRYYRPADMLLLGGIRKLLHEDGLTIKGVQKILREEGMAHVADMSPPLDAETDAQLDADLAARIDEDVAPEPVEADVVPFAASPEPEPEEAPQPAAPQDEMSPLPSFLKTPTPPNDALETTAPRDDVSAEAQTGLPYPPLVEDIPVPDTIDGDVPDDEVADGAPHLAEEDPAPEHDDAPVAFEPVDSPPEAVDTHLNEAAEPDDAPMDEAEPPAPVADDRSTDPDLFADIGASEPEPSDIDIGAAAPTDTVEVEDPAEAPAAEATTSGLPSFLSDYAAPSDAGSPAPAVEDAPPSEEPEPVETTAPKARIVDVPDDPDPDSIEVAASALSKAAGLTHLTDAQRSMIRPLLAQLATLRDQMASNRREPR